MSILCVKPIARRKGHDEFGFRRSHTAATIRDHANFVFPPSIRIL